MGTAIRALEVAAGQIGYQSATDPEPGSKYGRWYAAVTQTPYFGMSGVPWCAMFASWVMAQSGTRAAGIPGASCTAIMGAAKRAGAWLPASKLGAGDLVLFDWDRDGSPDHIGIVESVTSYGFVTIEGNTSSGSAGSQSNGGGVWRRSRAVGYVLGGVRPAYETEEDEDTVTEKDKQDIARMCAEYVYGKDKDNNLNMYNAVHWGYTNTSTAVRLLKGAIVTLERIAKKVGA